ncbi:MAG: hypothetical protein IJO69_02050 [Ruminiclostridium sp.]|nr:hypothetical protein [Ruminiclostridium sp.]
MANYRAQLRDLQQKAYQKNHLENLAAELEKEYEDLKQKVFLYEAQMNQEQADVDKLEGRSLAAFFAGLRGNKEERLDKERQEARAARVKYDMALLERNQVEDQLRRTREELADLETIPAQREAILDQWAQAVKAVGGAAGKAVLDLEEKRAWHEGQRREITEAVAAGQEALTQANEIMTKLSDAEGWGTWDMFGGGMLSSLMKYEAIDEAQAKVEGLQLALRRFRTELVDVSIDADLNFTMDGTTQFFDVFFDNIFTDWAVMDEISKSQNRVGQLRDQIRALEETLTQTDSQHQADLEQLDRDLEDLLLKMEQDT